MKTPKLDALMGYIRVQSDNPEYALGFNRAAQSMGEHGIQKVAATGDCWLKQNPGPIPLRVMGYTDVPRFYAAGLFN